LLVFKLKLTKLSYVTKSHRCFNQCYKIVLPYVGVGAAWRTAGVEPGSTVAIFGLGSIGLAV